MTTVEEVLVVIRDRYEPGEKFPAWELADLAFLGETVTLKALAGLGELVAEVEPGIWVFTPERGRPSGLFGADREAA